MSYLSESVGDAGTSDRDRLYIVPDMKQVTLVQCNQSLHVTASFAQDDYMQANMQGN